MALIDRYIDQPDMALVDAAASPAFQRFIQSSDLVFIEIDVGNGHLAQVQAVSREAIERVLARLIAAASQRQCSQLKPLPSAG